MNENAPMNQLEVYQGMERWQEWELMRSESGT